MLTKEAYDFLDKYQTDYLRRIVEWLEKAPETIKKKESGICKNLEEAFLMLDSEEFVAILSKGWPKHSDSVYFQIPATDEKCSGSGTAQYLLCDNLWEGEQGQLRVELCKYMADQLRKYLGLEN